MGVLKIDCYCNEKQMSRMLDLVINHLEDSDRTDIADLDDMIDGIRVCVEFETYMDKVTIKVSEVLDRDWDVLYEDTAVLTSRLKSIINRYNKRNKENISQALEIRRDQLLDYGIDFCA